MSRMDPTTGQAKKAAYGPWMLKAFGVLAKLRRAARHGASTCSPGRPSARWSVALIGEYEALVDELLGALAPHNHALAVELARLPEQIRGYGYVKHRHVEAARVKQEELLAAFRASTPPRPRIEVLAAA